MMNLNELVGKEISFTELDNAMVEKGFYSVAADGIMEDIKESKNVYYQNASDDVSVILNFELINNENDFELVVTSVL